MLAEVSAGLTSLKAAGDIVRGLQAASTQAAVNDARIQLQQFIIDAQAALMAAQERQDEQTARVRDLTGEIERLTRWDQDASQYELMKSESGAVAYRLKQEFVGAEPRHILCPHCFSQRRKGHYQPTKDHVMRDTIYKCQSCGGTAPFAYEDVN